MMYQVERVLMMHGMAKEAQESITSFSTDYIQNGCNIYLFCPDEATTPIKDFFYFAVALRGNPPADEHGKARLWEETLTWLNANKEVHEPTR